MVRVCESNIIFPCVRPSVRGSVHLSVTLSPPKPLGGIQPNLLNHFPLWCGCAKATFFPCVSCPYMCPSRYLLLNHWAEFNQTCYITSPNGKGCDSNIIFPCVRPSICPSRYLLLNHWAEFNQTCYITSHHSKGVRELHYFSVRPSGVCPSVRHTISS